ncbi:MULTISPECIES: hypothetical protein [Lactococcus]|uniref:hypothetical protein n=1 Tax=Lactococcus TaxID=1357 RepID=UPI00288EC469|nr:hypothetical protein [Lactococcus garvieae]MDT2742927.1 hypothetical protein [Lactococcus garvieae]
MNKETQEKFVKEVINIAEKSNMTFNEIENCIRLLNKKLYDMQRKTKIKSD